MPDAEATISSERPGSEGHRWEFWRDGKSMSVPVSWLGWASAPATSQENPAKSMHARWVLAYRSLLLTCVTNCGCRRHQGRVVN